MRAPTNTQLHSSPPTLPLCPSFHVQRAPVPQRCSQPAQISSAAAPLSHRSLLSVTTLPAAASDTASLLSDSPQQETREPANTAQALNAVELKSAVQQDYSVLKEHLSQGAFQKADDETRAKLIQLAGKEASKRNWVYFSEVQFIPTEDLQTIDELWKAASGGAFGFSAQREIWLQNRKYWTRFFKAISWVTGDRNNYRKWPGEFIYSSEAPKGHLPLTNCLRGTQLFEAILQHPAFVKEQNNPDWMS